MDEDSVMEDSQPGNKIELSDSSAPITTLPEQTAPEQLSQPCISETSIDADQPDQPMHIGQSELPTHAEQVDNSIKLEQPTPVEESTFEKMQDFVIEYPAPNLVDTLRLVMARLDHVLELKKKPDSRIEITNLYQKEIRSLLMAARYYNREHHRYLDSMNDKAKKLISELNVMESVYESMIYKVSSIAADAQARKDETCLNDIGIIKSLEDHKERMQALDVEEIRRRELDLQFSKLQEEIRQLEFSCSTGAKQLNEVKPYVEQLVEKANTTLDLEPLSQ